MSWCELDLTFDLAVVTLTYKIVNCRKLIVGGIIRDSRYAS